MMDIISITEEWRVVKTRAVVTGVAQQDNLDLTVSTIAISRVPTLVGKSTWGRNFSFFFNFGRKKVGILRKSGNFRKYLNSFL